MILLLDAGNSIINIGIHDGDKIVKTFSLETKKIRTKDEFAVILISLLNFNSIRKEEITAGVLASVVPSVNKPIIEAMEAYFSISMIIVEPGVKTGIKLKVDNPKEVAPTTPTQPLPANIITVVDDNKELAKVEDGSSISDNYSVTLPNKAKPVEKVLLTIAGIMIDYQYFEKNTNPR